MSASPQVRIMPGPLNLPCKHAHATREYCHVCAVLQDELDLLEQRRQAELKLAEQALEKAQAEGPAPIRFDGKSSLVPAGNYRFA